METGILFNTHSSNRCPYSQHKEKLQKTPDEKCIDEGIVLDGGCTPPENVSGFPRQLTKMYTLEEVSNHCEYSSCWIALFDKVYDITDFVFEHPGGCDILLENAGRDATIPFLEVGHSQEAVQILEPYFIGNLKVEKGMPKAKVFNSFAILHEG